MIQIKKTFLILLFILSYAACSVHAQPGPPSLISPSDGSTDQSTAITFEWSSVSSADRYQIQVATDQSFSSSSLVFEDNTTATSISVSGFSHNTTYYWRVRSGQDDPILGTSYGEWSDMWDFTTVESPPSAPALSSPEDEASGVSPSPTLDWQSADRASSYELQVDQTSDFSSAVVDEDGISGTEQKVTDLQPTTTYYWRVRANNNGGSSSWSQVWSFTTAEAEPPTVQLVSPDSSATNVTTTPRLDWQKAERADFYDFQLATDQAFNQTVVKLNNVTSTHYDAELEGFTTYYWRVRGKNSEATGDWSHVWSFTTERTGNEISIATPSGNTFWKAGNNSSIHWEATNNIDHVTIQYKAISEESWSLIADSINADSSPYGWEVPASASPRSYIKIADADNADISTISDPLIIYPDSVGLQHEYSFSSTTSTSDYRLIGLPAQTDIPLHQMIPGKAGQAWNAYYDDGTQENYLIEYNGSKRFNAQPGRAFFVISKNEISLAKEAPSVPLSSDTTFTIPLHNGWNMIANPYGVSIPWKEIQDKNNIQATLWGFDGQYTETEQFKAFEGYYIFNKDSLQQLEIPYSPSVQNQSTTGKQLVSQTNNKTLTLKLLSDGVERSSIQVGFNPTAKKEEYQFAPPGDFQDYKLTIESKQFSGRQVHMSEAILPGPSQKQTFSIRLKSKPNEPVILQPEGVKRFGQNEIVLIDRKTSKSYDIGQGHDVQLQPDQTESSYLLVMGSAEEVKETKSNLKPTQITLSQNYPNPFNGQTVIEYSIPKAKQHSHVTLRVYNILGQKVLTLVDEQKSAGAYKVRWNPEQNGSQALASGVYYYRLKVGAVARTKKLTLIE